VEGLSGLGMAFSGGMLEKGVADGKAGLLRDTGVDRNDGCLFIFP
jgi:hypothetical protein